MVTDANIDGSKVRTGVCRDSGAGRGQTRRVPSTSQFTAAAGEISSKKAVRLIAFVLQ